MSRNFNDARDASYRYLMLEFLARCNAHTSNTQIVQLWLEHLGAVLSHEAIRIHAYWLEEQQLIACRPVDDTLEVYTLTPRGHEVARGITRMPGVWHPAFASR